jgi:hypothetical protein
MSSPKFIFFLLVAGPPLLLLPVLLKLYSLSYGPWTESSSNTSSEEVEERLQGRLSVMLESGSLFLPTAVLKSARRNIPEDATHRW